MLGGAEDLFRNGRKTAAVDYEARQSQLYEESGRLKMELDWVKKKRAYTVAAKRALVEVDHPQLSIVRQCDLLGLGRSTFSDEPATESAQNLALMKLLDQQYTDCPF